MGKTEALELSAAEHRYITFAGDFRARDLHLYTKLIYKHNKLSRQFHNLYNPKSYFNIV